MSRGAISDDDDEFDPSGMVLPAEGPSASPLSSFAQRAAAVLWPAFLMAGVLEMLVFAFVDPQELQWLGGAPLDLARGAVYTLAFFAFWLIVGLAGAITQLLLAEPRGEHRLDAKRRFP